MCKMHQFLEQPGIRESHADEENTLEKHHSFIFFKFKRRKDYKIK